MYMYCMYQLPIFNVAVVISIVYTLVLSKIMSALVILLGGVPL